jgi:hypothetical protein
MKESQGGRPQLRPGPTCAESVSGGGYLSRSGGGPVFGLPLDLRHSKAVMEGRLRAVGRRGGVGTLLFTRIALDRFGRRRDP